MENGKTNIYIKESKFRVCKLSLLNIPKGVSIINSIDEVIENFEENTKLKLSPEEEFWGHCSNLQAWYESG